MIKDADIRRLFARYLGDYVLCKLACLNRRLGHKTNRSIGLPISALVR